MIAGAILAILAAVAVPAYQDSVRKGRRAEAFTVLAAVQQAQERWRGNHPSYSGTLANTSAADAPPNGLGVPSNSASSLYAVALSDASDTGYTVTATANAGTSQAGDGNCRLIGVQMDGGNIKYGSSATVIAWADANADAGRCWAR